MTSRKETGEKKTETKLGLFPMKILVYYMCSTWAKKNVFAALKEKVKVKI